jgi:feruloyl esterase
MIDPLEATVQVGNWALTSPGNVNWALLQDFASVSLDDMTHLAKSVIEKFYSKAAKCKASPA